MSLVVTFLLDRSGSMASIKDATIEAFNAYIKTLKEETKDGETFTLVTFDSVGIDKVQLNVPIKDAKELNNDSYVPRAATPLVDAACKTIIAVENAVAARTDNPNVIICIQTDGQENASVEYSFSELNTLIKAKMAIGWQFNFMGAGIDAYKQATAMGLSAFQTMSYATDPGHTHAAFSAVARNSRAYASGMQATTNFSVQDKMAAGDAYDKNINQTGQPNKIVSVAGGGIFDADALKKAKEHQAAKKHPNPTTGKIVDDLKL